MILKIRNFLGKRLEAFIFYYQIKIYTLDRTSILEITSDAKMKRFWAFYNEFFINENFELRIDSQLSIFLLTWGAVELVVATAAVQLRAPDDRRETPASRREKISKMVGEGAPLISL